MPWTPLNFGKYKDKTLPQVVLMDPDWFFWAWEEKIFQDKPIYLREVEDIFRKSTHIKVPQRGGEKIVVEYVINPASLKFDSARLVPASSPRHEGASQMRRLDVFSLRFPRDIKTYDKYGGKSLIEVLKRDILGNPRMRLTKRCCEAFFDDPNNFCL